MSKETYIFNKFIKEKKLKNEALINKDELTRYFINETGASVQTIRNYLWLIKIAGFVTLHKSNFIYNEKAHKEYLEKRELI